MEHDKLRGFCFWKNLNAVLLVSIYRGKKANLLTGLSTYLK